MKLLSDLYNVTLKRGIEGAAKGGFIRPTIGQSFMSDRDYDATVRPVVFLGYTSDVCEGGVITSSHETPHFSARTPDKAFDNDAATYWDTYSTDTSLCWLTYDFGAGNEKRIQKYTIMPYSGYAPTSWIFKGSNDNVVWDDLDTQTVAAFSDQKVITFENKNSYRYYKLDISASQVINRTILREVEMMEGVYAEEGGVEARSVIFDFADGYLSSGHSTSGGIGVRSIEFYVSGILSPLNSSDFLNPLTSSDFTAYSTSIFSSYVAANAFDTTKSKTGSHIGTTWLSDSYKYTNQRLIVVFNAPIIFNYIVINNFHGGGGYTTSGVKNTIIRSTTDIYTNTTYDAEILNQTLLWEGIIPEHISSDVVDDFSIII